MLLVFWMESVWVATEVETRDRVKIGVDVRALVRDLRTRCVLEKGDRVTIDIVVRVQ